MTLNLLLFAITFTIFLEIEFDFIFYVPYRSEEISPWEASWSRYEAGQSLIDGFDNVHEPAELPGKLILP